MPDPDLVDPNVLIPALMALRAALSEIQLILDRVEREAPQARRRGDLVLLPPLVTLRLYT